MAKGERLKRLLKRREAKLKDIEEHEEKLEKDGMIIETGIANLKEEGRFKCHRKELEIKRKELEDIDKKIEKLRKS